MPANGISILGIANSKMEHISKNYRCAILAFAILAFAIFAFAILAFAILAFAILAFAIFAFAIKFMTRYLLISLITRKYLVDMILINIFRLGWDLHHSPSPFIVKTACILYLQSINNQLKFVHYLHLVGAHHKFVGAHHKFVGAHHKFVGAHHKFVGAH
jgi:hypothetical protein